MAAKEPEAAPSSPTAAEEPSAASSKKRKSAALKEIEVDLRLPEPPSKKIRRALKKGKTIPAKPQSSDDEDADGVKKSDDAKAKKKERSPYGVWIGNLRFNASKAELRKWLIDNSGGVITDELITRVHMPTTKPAAGTPKAAKTQENRGFAYVDFSTFEANVAAIALSETELAGRKLLIKDSNSFEGRPKKVEAEEGAEDDAATGAPVVRKKNPSTKVFVGNLSFQVTEDDLHAHFEKCGPIRWIKVATFEDTGKCKGYGWVNFEEPEAAEWAVKGFVKVRETIETLEDFMDEDQKPAEEPATNAADGNGSDAEGQDGTKKAPAGDKKKKKKIVDPESPVRIKTRKWWVNQLFGRPLKIELAEDDHVRYNKRFRGNGPQRKEKHEFPAATGDAPPRRSEGAGADAAAGSPDEKRRAPPSKAMNYSTDVNVARLTGAPVAHQGKKTTFE